MWYDRGTYRPWTPSIGALLEGLAFAYLRYQTRFTRAAAQRWRLASYRQHASNPFVRDVGPGLFPDAALQRMDPVQEYALYVTQALWPDQRWSLALRYGILGRDFALTYGPQRSIYLQPKFYNTLVTYAVPHPSTRQRHRWRQRQKLFLLRSGLLQQLGFQSGYVHMSAFAHLMAVAQQVRYDRVGVLPQFVRALKRFLV